MLYIALRVGIRKRLAAFWCHFSGAFCPYIEIITNVSNYVSGSVSGLLSAIFFYQEDFCARDAKNSDRTKSFAFLL